MPEVGTIRAEASGAASHASSRAEPAEGHRVGLALSGGGSRAAAFHRGTVRALQRLGLLRDVDVVSTVSGGSVFGGAWMAARARGTSDGDCPTRPCAGVPRPVTIRHVAPPAAETEAP